MHGAKLLQVDGNFDDCLDPGPRPAPRTTRSRWSTRSTRSASRARRPPPSRSSTRSATRPTSTACRSATPATSRRTGRATRSTPRTDWPPAPRGCAASRPAGAAPIVRGAPVREPADDRDRDPDRQPGVLGPGARRARRVRRRHRGGHRPADPRGLPAAGRTGGRLRRAGLGRQRRRAAAGRRGRPGRPGPAGRLHRHRQRPQGPRVGDRRRAAAARSCRSTPRPPRGGSGSG